MKPNLFHIVTEDEPKVFGSARFIRLSRNPALRSPKRFEPTKKEVGDVVI